MKTKTMLYGTEDTIDRSIDIIISNDIKKVLGINPNIYTIFSDTLKGKRAKGKLGTYRKNTIPSEYLQVLATEKGEENNSSVLMSERSLSWEVFQDTSVDVKVGALKYNKKRTLELTYFSQSRSKVEALVQKIQTFDIYNYGKKRHKIEYNYDLPQNVLFFLDHVRNLKNNRLEKDEQVDNLPDYINKHSVQQISRKNVNSSLPYKFNLSIREHAYLVDGLMETETYEIEKDKGETNYWYFTITYSIWYHKPIMLALNYPLLIWNQPLNPRYTKVVTRPEIRAPIQGRTTPSFTGLYDISVPFSKMRRLTYHQQLTIPLADDFFNFPSDKMYKNVASFLIIVDDKNPYDVLNIKDLPNYKIKTPFLKYILKHHKDINIPYGSLFQMELYRNGKKDYRNPIKMDEEGNVTTEFPMQIKSTYRIIIRILRDLDFLNGLGLEDLNKFVKDEMDEYVKNHKVSKEHKHNFKSPNKQYEKYYVDEFGNIVNEEGYIVYTDGEKIVKYVDCTCDCHKP